MLVIKQKKKIWKDAIGIECNTKNQFCVLQKKVLSFGPNRTVEVQPNSSAEPNVRSVTTMDPAPPVGSHGTVITYPSRGFAPAPPMGTLGTAYHNIT
jgi:hypothetical protein